MLKGDHSTQSHVFSFLPSANRWEERPLPIGARHRLLHIRRLIFQNCKSELTLSYYPLLGVLLQNRANRNIPSSRMRWLLSALTPLFDQYVLSSEGLANGPSSLQPSLSVFIGQHHTSSGTHPSIVSMSSGPPTIIKLHKIKLCSQYLNLTACS